MNRIRHDYTLRLIAVLGLISLAILVILSIENMLTSFLLAIVIVYLFAPTVNSLERMGMPRAISIVILFSIAIAFLTIALSMVFPLLSTQVNTLKRELPQYITGMSQLISSTEDRINLFLNSVYEIDISEELQTTMFTWASGLFEGLPGLAQKLLTVTMLAPFFAFFMLLDGRKASRNFLALVPNNLFEMALNLTHQLGNQIGHFIRARLLEAAIVGFVVWAGLELIDIRFAPLLALFAAITNLIPYVGPIIGAVPAFAIAFLNGAASFDLFLLLLVYGVAQLIDIVFIIPLVVAKIVDLHPVTVVIVIIIGSQLLGILGMIISIPVASALKLIINAVFVHVVGFRR